jgi:hypothetical protein
MRVDVIDRVQMFFSALITSSRTTDVRAFAECGVVLAQSPIPILVLHPTASGSLRLDGTPDITIYGGPTRGMQVNSSSATAVNTGGDIDFSLGGPNNTGSDFGVFGASAECCNYNGGTTGSWITGTAPIADPLSQLPAPAQPANALASTHVNHGMWGCPRPDAGPNPGCTYYQAGYYPTGIQIQNETAIFGPGLYYISGGLDLDSNSTVRPAVGVGISDPDGYAGAMFYMVPPYINCSGITSSVCIGSNSGTASACTTPGVNSPNGCVDSFDTTPLTLSLRCEATSQLPGIVPASVNGNVLMAPCYGPYGDPLGASNPIGVQRGILFFQSRSTATGASGQFGGGGSLLLAGTMYYHQCVTSGADTGTGCSSSAYNATLSLAGNSGSSTYILGQIIADRLNMNGNPVITMVLNPFASSTTLKASLLR